ncbi:MAG TPA: ATP synthase subunit I [Pseudonocardiaceae bacterium]|jgi:hypothetical protein|nr:ATP synthase subunit I [Pseudonocardiaceae bacterium]
MSSLQPVVNIPAFVKANFRRTIILGVAIGAIALVALTLTGHVLLGLFGCLGILLGAINALLVQRSVVRYGTTDQASNTKKLLTGSIAGRLALTTVIAVVLAFVFAPSGIAVFAGLAVFQVLTLGSTALPMMREARQR